MKMLKMCLHPKVIAGLVVVAAGVWILAPQWFAAALPLLILAICPLSMIVMMKMMMPSDSGSDDSSPTTDEPAALQARIRQLEEEQAGLRDRMRVSGSATD